MTCFPTLLSKNQKGLLITHTRHTYDHDKYIYIAFVLNSEVEILEMWEQSTTRGKEIVPMYKNFNHDFFEVPLRDENTIRNHLVETGLHILLIYILQKSIIWKYTYGKINAEFVAQ